MGRVNPKVAFSARKLAPSEMETVRSMAAGSVTLDASRSVMRADDGRTLGLPAGLVLTIADATLIPAGLTVQAPADGGGTLVVGGSVTFNGGVSPIALSARQVAVLLPTTGSSTDLTVKVV